VEVVCGEYVSSYHPNWYDETYYMNLKESEKDFLMIYG